MSKASSSYARLSCPPALPRGRGERKKCKFGRQPRGRKSSSRHGGTGEAPGAAWPPRASQARPLLLGSGPLRAPLRALSLSTPTRTKAVITLDTFTAFPQRIDGGRRRPRRDHRVRDPRESGFFVKSIYNILTVGISCGEEIGDGSWSPIFKSHPFLPFPKPHLITLRISLPTYKFNQTRQPSAKGR